MKKNEQNIYGNMILFINLTLNAQPDNATLCALVTDYKTYDQFYI